jgi:hypothetical protein
MEPNHWRLQVLVGAAKIEHKGVGVLDEVAFADWLHVEQMTDDTWWFRVGDAQLHVTVVSGAAPRVDVVRGAFGEVSGKTEEWNPAPPGGEP